eukprot:gb/GEZN01012405.1/.p1 GENE.gb/GEZN01012405.1/~~gb/GEZN01012405.1/.p1  ORF type:complete len:242 (+),score=53.77 gb/GEZN01012405.1/:23-748(+)
MASKSDADKQIEQMIQFIAQEAREKSEEIAVKIASEVEEERQMKIQELSASIREEFEQKSKERAIAARIERSKALNNQRYLGMRHRDDLMKTLKEDVRKRFSEISSSPKYPELLCFLMAQGFLTIQEKEVTVKCRKEDVAAVEKQLSKAIELYKNTVKAKTGISPEVKAEVSKTEYLAPGAGSGVLGETCAGGVEVSAKGGQLLCRNTLDSRLDRAFYQLQPQLRGLLFGVRGAPGENKSR